MRVLRDVCLGSANKSLRRTYPPWVLPEKDRIIETIKAFVQQTPGWQFDECGAQESPSATQFMVRCGDDVGRWTLIPFFHEVRSRCFKSRQPVPEEYGRTVFLDESNRILERFVKEFQRFSKKSGIKMGVRLTKENFTLKDIITSDIARGQFETYLKGYPLSWHANDVKQLDRFTVRQERYGKEPVRLDLLERHLKEDLGWPEDSASRCTERIQVGLDVLRVYPQRNLTYEESLHRKEMKDRLIRKIKGILEKELTEGRSGR